MPDSLEFNSGFSAETVRHAAAVRRAVREAVRQHALLGRSVVGWRDGQIVWYTPEQILADDWGRDSPSIPPPPAAT